MDGKSGKATWADKDVDEILWDINKALVEAWAASEYDESAMANHILLPPAKYAYIQSTRIGTSGNESILTYILKNNLAVNQERLLKLFLAVGALALVLVRLTV